MKIQILGSGCSKCETLTENAIMAVEELGTDCEIVKVKEMDQILSFGVMMTPALAINGKVKSSGKVLSIEEIKKYISEI
ncbi:MAG: thioredoxin family protein [Deltaproteobacteria bacterium]|jgi:small redox-active disulfide protein 2|nr:thioredoxin family protein [Deltaproteobacteria bacterium]